MDWQTLVTHWKWLFGSLPMALIAWLGRQKGIHPWRSFKRQLDLNKINISVEMENQRLRNDLKSAEESRTNEQRLREAATAALTAMVQTGKVLEEERAAGRIVISGPSLPRHGTSPTGGAVSRPKRKPGPLDLPSR